MVNKYELTEKIENFAPLDSAEPWDNSGWLIETPKTEANKILLCLTVTDDIIKQAKENGCDMIISHHPLFCVPICYNCGVDIYCAHTNLDKAPIGTTETLIKELGLTTNKEIEHDFLRFCDVNTTFCEVLAGLKPLSNNIRYTNPQETTQVKRIAFCGGSGTEFWHDACEHGADILITGDLKFHTALDSKIAIIDIGHFESEIIVLEALRQILPSEIEIIKAKEKSPIKQINS